MSRRSTAKDAHEPRELPEPAEWVERYGDSLYRFALARLRRSHEAEEAVQEALLAALKSRAQFRGRSHPRTWLMGILHHKVLSRLREAARRAPITPPDDLDRWFDGWGHWRRAPGAWGDPAAAAEREDFWEVVRRCLRRLPARMAEAFTLRTVAERTAAEVCRDLAITASNLWVLMHRARLRMVRCLQQNWFADGGRE
jgi:RNA polymerase sigma-70 factor (TIGR02943 family)